MSSVVCEICRKSCSSLVSTKIKNGFMCVDCAVKFDAMGGKHDSELYDSETYIEALKHPADAPKLLHTNVKNPKKVCSVCQTGMTFGQYIANDLWICDVCESNCQTIERGIVGDRKEFFASHDVDFFKEELKECYNPKHNIAFNFKTKKVYFKDALSKKNYKLVSFDDLVSCEIKENYSSVSQGMVHSMILDYRYNGKTVRYVSDDSTDKHYEFEKTKDCLSRIPQISQYITGNTNENTAINNIQPENINVANNVQNVNSMNQLRCPKCGGTNCTPIVETSTDGKDFSAGKGCCGYVLLGPLGILCGACGGGKQTTSKTYWMCSNCGNKFTK